MQQLQLPVGNDRWTISCDADRLLTLHRHGPIPETITDVRTALAHALDHPLRYVPLHQTITPDDRITIVLDERIPALIDCLVVVIEHLGRAGVPLNALTVLTAPGLARNWQADLPESLRELQIIRHQPSDATQLAYVATTTAGRRVYLHRALADADASIILSRRTFDPLHGHGGSASFLFPRFSDHATQRQFAEHYTTHAPGKRTRAAFEESEEVAWLIGEPFFVQFIASTDGEVAHIIAGRHDANSDGQALLESAWHCHVDETAEIVIATLSGDPAQHDFSDLARALGAASRIIEPDGRMVLLTQAEPLFDAGATILQRSGGLRQAHKRLVEECPPDFDAAFLWAHAAQKARIFISSRIAPRIIEQLHAAPIERSTQVERIIGATGKVAILPDAHQLLVTLGK